MKKFYAWYQKHITGAIFIGLLLGILTGLFLADRFAPVLTVTSLLGGIYMNALNMMIFPLVFCSVVMGICSIGSIKTTGKITGASMAFFLCTTALASLAGLIIPRLIHLGEGHFRYCSYRYEQYPGYHQKPDSIQSCICFCTGQHASGSCLCSYYRIYTDCCRREG